MYEGKIVVVKLVASWVDRKKEMRCGAGWVVKEGRGKKKHKKKPTKRWALSVELKLLSSEGDVHEAELRLHEGHGPGS